MTPVELAGGWAGTVHLAGRAGGSDTLSAPEGAEGSDPSRPAGAEWPTRTLCGRPYVRIVTEPGLDLLGDDARLVCKSCWRIVEGWLSPPPVAEGEADVVRWIVAAVLETGEAMVEGVPVPRLVSIRQRVRSELKSTKGGSVHTYVIGLNALLVRSGLVIDARTPEQWQKEMHAAAERMWAIEAGEPVDAPRWRRRWEDITGIR